MRGEEAGRERVEFTPAMGTDWSIPFVKVCLKMESRFASPFRLRRGCYRGKRKEE